MELPNGIVWGPRSVLIREVSWFQWWNNTIVLSRHFGDQEWVYWLPDFSGETIPLHWDKTSVLIKQDVPTSVHIKGIPLCITELPIPNCKPPTLISISIGRSRVGRIGLQEVERTFPKITIKSNPNSPIHFHSVSQSTWFAAEDWITYAHNFPVKTFTCSTTSSKYFWDSQIFRTWRDMTHTQILCSRMTVWL